MAYTLSFLGHPRSEYNGAHWSVLLSEDHSKRKLLEVLMDHISHHLNPGSLKTKHTADRSGHTEREKPAHSQRCGMVFSQKVLSQEWQLLKYQRDTEITENTQGG